MTGQLPATRERGLPERGELSTHAALCSGRPEDALVVLAQVQDLLELMPLIRAIVARASDAAREGTDGLGRLLSARPELSWSVGMSPESSQAVMDRMIRFEAFRQPDAGEEALALAARPGERSQLRYDFMPGHEGTVFVHYFLEGRFDDVAEVFACVRWIHAGQDEEVMLRLRPTSLVVGRSIELRQFHVSRPNLVSIGRFEDCDVILVNGLPVLWRRATTAFPTGVALDLIGSPRGTTCVDLRLFMVSRDGLPAYCRGFDISGWARRMVAAYAGAEDVPGLVRWLYAMDGLDYELTYDVFEAAFAANLAEQKGYRDFVTDGLLAKLPLDRRTSALQRAAASEPRPIVSVEGATVRIASNPSEHASLRYVFGRRPDKIELLSDINFRAYAGDIVGIIGKNGAGKSTLLRTLVAAMPLARGKIGIDGRPLLLRPGAGMQGDLTGRENVLKTGLYMGFLPSELRELMDEIIAFSELEEHIDRPFRYYSDGMRARLIFALATSIPRDILLFDELLSAGDMGFQRKAMKRLDDFIARAKLVFVVQHTFDFVVSRCTKCLFLDHGRPVYFGDPAIATELYKESL
jgi:ABC-type polysaccharide/polyol phosphate transport system ATPase subunit